MNVFNVKYEVLTKKGCKSKFILIGDLHGWVGNEQISKVVDNIKDGNPDIIFIAGDILAESYQWTQRGKVTKGSTIIKGNDIAVYNYGFDVMGDSHVKPNWPPDVARKLNERAGND